MRELELLLPFHAVPCALLERVISRELPCNDSIWDPFMWFPCLFNIITHLPPLCTNPTARYIPRKRTWYIYTTDREEKNTFRMCSHIHRLVSKLKMDKKYVRNEKIIKIYIFSIHIMDFGLFMYHLLRRPQGIFESLIHRPFSSFSCPTW